MLQYKMFVALNILFKHFYSFINEFLYHFITKFYSNINDLNFYL